ncbi:MAG: alpha/beta fold hydrolase [Bacteroidota bacterium]
MATNFLAIELQPPLLQFTGHLQTVLPAFRQINVPYQRERITTPDGDFLDLDWLKKPSYDRLVILCHGLEGNSERPYISGAARYFFARNWDVLAWMCRSCSGEMNRTPRLYSHGQSEDVATVVEHADRTGKYRQIVLIGYSMGGNLVLKYLGVAAGTQPASVTHGIAFSAPCRIEHSVDALEQRANWLYKRKFYVNLHAKIMHKAAQFPEQVGQALGVAQERLIRQEPDLWRRLQSSKRPDSSEPQPAEWAPKNRFVAIFERNTMPAWRTFDELYSAPLNGFETAEDFYHYASAANFMTGTTVPVLLVNAQNDPIIPPECTPWDLLDQNALLHIEQPKRGGHVGFMMRHEKRHTWMEERAEHFING